MPEDSQVVDFLVDRSDITECRIVPAGGHDEVELSPGEVLVAVDEFAFTANNITYALLGDMLRYWEFFPAESGWGRIPVWGFGDVVRSEHEGVARGERLYGYFPMSSWAVLRPSRTTPAIVDGSEHRRELPSVYNTYERTSADPLYEHDTEAWQMLFRPLFLTSFLLEDFLSEQDLAGAQEVVITSASSKTAFSLAALLTGEPRSATTVVGLTSSRNVGFVEGLGCYDRVVAYDDVATLDTDTPVAIVDMAGDPDLLSKLHHHFGEAVRLSSLVGFSHQGGPDGGAAGQDLPGASPALFFAPDRASKRSRDWGREELQERMARAWHEFTARSSGWLEIVSRHGAVEVERAYRDTLEGRVPPDQGLILSLR